MTRYYDLTVYYKRDTQEGFEKQHYSIITEEILNATKTKYESAYNRGEYVALRFEYEIIQ